ncbi:PDZ domain-containing protein [Hathewaya histolytica]|uniref:Trypsin-like serine protease with C-terminal PDZ domain n=1 Tax=Hathewaya histolytica TaxID=1498 RepID=A0A4U9QYM3_HATHI|nr:PDZ domain-containing protein [Hathewaya histolytica]VTQ83805.1 trypsin-like serine protease with C-terminal PDZ domain [Hathewaya histolytica]
MKIAFYTIQGIAYSITDPIFLILLSFLGIGFYKKNKRTAIMQKMVIGKVINSPLELTMSQIVIGLFGGIIGSLLLSYLGVAFPNNSIIYMLFFISIILMTISPRYICFSYSGALLGALILVINFIKKQFNLNIPVSFDINIVSLMTLIGVMHIVEGFLVIIDGSKGAIPVFANKENKIMGGFALNRYWSVPISIMFIVLNQNLGIAGGEQVATPQWWPIINGGITENILKSSIIMFMPLYAVVGYNSITFTKSKRKKSLVSGLLILGYGIILALVAGIGDFGYLGKIVVIIFAPIAHEGMLFLDTYLEIKGEAKYTSTEEGIMILEVAPNSPAEEMGIKSGDLLIEVNNKIIDSEKDILESVKEIENFLWLKIKKSTGEIKEVYYNRMNVDKRLGVVFVPKSIQDNEKFIRYRGKGTNNFKDILDKIKNSNEK